MKRLMQPQARAHTIWMASNVRAKTLGWVAALCVQLAGLAPLAAMPFTYQGYLVNNERAAQGDYELRLRLYDDPSAGTQVGSDASALAEGVTNGVFTVSVDFGPAAFTGASRWIEVAVRPKGSLLPLTVLTPRTAVTAVPYALHALSTPGDASTLTTGTVPDGRLSDSIARVLDVNVSSNALVNRIYTSSNALTDLVYASSNALGSRIYTTSNALSAAIQSVDNTLSARLYTASNSLNDRLYATQADLQLQLNQLSDRVAQLTAALPHGSGIIATSVPSGTVIASPVSGDLSLLSQGLVQFAKLDAPAWVSGATLNAPGARNSHGAVWTGSAMMIWGGINGLTPSGTGGSYDPATDSWSALPTVNAPAARRGHSIAWTGERLVVWGGQGSNYLSSGGVYNPTNRLWTPTPLAGAPAERVGQCSAWTGARLFVWGGRNDDGLLADGASYDPLGDIWNTLPETNAPAPRRLATATWCGDRVIVWGGETDGGDTDTGAALPMLGGVTHGEWSALSTSNAPAPRQGHTAVWTGSRLLIWGGKSGGVPLNDGAAYDPLTDTWASLPTLGAASARSSHVAVWTGREMVVFGGEDQSDALGTGAAYDPDTGIWHALTSSGGALPRRAHTGVWTGTELIVFGGLGAGTPAASLAAVQRLLPEATWNLYRKP